MHAQVKYRETNEARRQATGNKQKGGKEQEVMNSKRRVPQGLANVRFHQAESAKAHSRAPRRVPLPKAVVGKRWRVRHHLPMPVTYQARWEDLYHERGKDSA